MASISIIKRINSVENWKWICAYFVQIVALILSYSNSVTVFRIVTFIITVMLTTEELEIKRKQTQTELNDTTSRDVYACEKQ